MRDIPYFRLSAFYFVYLAALGAFSPYFALYLDQRGLSAVAISVVMSLWYGTRMISPSVWGHLTLHSPKPIRWLRIGCAATLVCFAGFLLPLPWLGILAVMAAYSFFYNATMPQFEAITLSHLGDQPARYGRIRVWGSVGFVLVVIVLGRVFDSVSVAWLPWIMLPIFAILIAVAFANDYGPTHHQQAGVNESLLTSLRRPGVRLFLLVAMLMQIAHGPYYVFFSLYLKANGYRPLWLGTFWAVGVLAEIVMFWFAAGILQRHDATRLLRLCLLTAALRFAVTALFPQSLPVMLMAQLSHALTFGLFHASCMHYIARLFPPRVMGQGQGLLYGLGSGVGGVTGSLLAGLCWDLGGGITAFFIAAVAAALGALFAWRMLDAPAATARSEVATVTDEAA